MTKPYLARANGITVDVLTPLVVHSYVFGHKLAMGWVLAMSGWRALTMPDPAGFFLVVRR